jgi:hypothetical protein
MLLMRQALAKGFADPAQLADDDDLKPLRKRSDFKKLVQELEARAARPK